jgi:hypothetical protein
MRVDFHVLRHTCASLLASSGVSGLARVRLAWHGEFKKREDLTEAALESHVPKLFQLTVAE